MPGSPVSTAVKQQYSVLIQFTTQYLMTNDHFPEKWKTQEKGPQTYWPESHKMVVLVVVISQSFKICRGKTSQQLSQMKNWFQFLKLLKFKIGTITQIYA